MTRYSPEFKEQMVRRMMPPNNQSVASLAQHRNTRGLIDSTEYTRGGWSMIHRTLAYDANGNLETITGSGIGGPVDRLFADGFDGSSGSLARSFAYDAIDRLTSATSSQYGSESFRYDPLGNLRSHVLNGVTTTFSYEPTTGPVLNRLESVNGTPYGYDDRGNVDLIGDLVDGFALTYNLANEVILDSKGTDFEYDARGWRVHQDVDIEDTNQSYHHNRYFVYDSQGRLIERIDNGVVTDYVYLGSMPVARIEGTTTPTYIHSDYQHTPILETDPSGNITRSPVYLAYGFVAEGGGNYKGLDRAPGYAGTYPEIETGLNYMGARYYFGAIGRFLTPDAAPLNPLSPVGLNRYVYASDSPARYTDPNGRQSQGPNGYGWYGAEPNWFRDSFLGSTIAHMFGDPIAVFRSDHYNPINGRVLTPGETQGAKYAMLGALIPVGRLETAAAPVVESVAATVSRKIVVIGEDMEGRVIPFAKKIGADWYKPDPSAPPSKWMGNNRKWINDRMDEGCQIIDCGAAPGRANYPQPTSPYFRAEHDEILQRRYKNYSKQDID